MATDKHMYFQKGFKYQITKDYKIDIEIHSPEPIHSGKFLSIENGELLIRAGYSFDGPSGPTFDTKSSMRGALVHDALYQLMRNGELDISWREYADKLLRKICIEDGMWKWRANYWYFGVVKFAEPAAEEKNIRTTFRVP